MAPRFPFARLASVPASAADMRILAALWITNLLFNVVANAGFRVSALSSTPRSFLLWQVVGNVAGFATALTLTGLLHFLPLHVAFPVSTGLAVVGVQVLGAAWLFRESVSPVQWLGTVLIAAGIVLVAGRGNS
jgi:multidrug transporter EmrE-like cation transporter